MVYYRYKGTTRETWCHKALGAKGAFLCQPAAVTKKEEKVMKTKWFSKVFVGLAAFMLVFSTASLADAKGSDKEKAEESKGTEEKKENQSKKDEETKQVKEDKKTKKEKKKAKILSKKGKEFEKRLTSIEKDINKITKSINEFFGVNGVTEKEYTKKQVSSRYNSYKGKLNAQINKLRSVEKQLKAQSKKFKSNRSDFELLVAKLNELKTLAKSELERLHTLKKEVLTPKPKEETTVPEEETSTPPKEETTVPKEETTVPKEESPATQNPETE